MTDASPERVEEIDKTDAELLVADPEDYHEAQRLREIHQARQDVRKKLHETDAYGTKDEHDAFKNDLAMSISAYIAELEPLMLAVEYDDTLERVGWDSLRDYADNLGHRPEKGKIAGYQASVFVYRKANQFLAEVKPLVVEEETNEWEI